jgi:hypothetical protein
MLTRDMIILKVIKGIAMLPKDTAMTLLATKTTSS